MNTVHNSRDPQPCSLIKMPTALYPFASFVLNFVGFAFVVWLFVWFLRRGNRSTFADVCCICCTSGECNSASSDLCKFIHTLYLHLICPLSTCGVGELGKFIDTLKGDRHSLVPLPHLLGPPWYWLNSETVLGSCYNNIMHLVWVHREKQTISSWGWEHLILTISLVPSHLRSWEMRTK